MSLQALIFDVDGTMAETEETHYNAFYRALADACLEWLWSRERYRKLRSDVLVVYAGMPLFELP